MVDRRIFTYVIFIIHLMIGFNCAGQSKSQLLLQRNYLKNNNEGQETPGNMEFKMLHADYRPAELYLFGAFHGSESPQLLDFALFKQLVLTKQVRYYLPELDYTLAHYLNKYLASGKLDILKMIVLKYQKRVPQDGSKQFFDKWIKIKSFNDSLPANNKIEVLGIDAIISPNLYINHLDEILKSSSYSNPILDSLSFYKNQQWDDYELYNNLSSSLGNYLLKIHTDLNNKPDAYQAGLNSRFFDFKMLIDNASYILGNTYVNRDSIMAENYISLKKSGKLSKGHSYGFMGFSHVYQDKISGKPPFACYLKDKKIITTSILGMMKDSDVMWKLRRNHSGAYKNYTIAHNQAGYKWNYRQSGIKLLESVSGKHNITLFRLNNVSSPFKNDLSFVNLSTGAKANGWYIDSKLNTLDFIQYVIFIKNSKAVVPIQAAFPGIEIN